MKHTCCKVGYRGRVPGVICKACNKGNERRRNKWMKAGLCDRCGKRKPEKSKISCSYCLWRNQVANLPIQAKKQAIKTIKKFKGACECCGGKSTGNKRRWNLDHNHKTRKFRGILCYRCNAALGISKENIKRLKAMIKYIRKHSHDIALTGL